MAKQEIHDRRSGEVYSGRNWSSIARRVWGRKAEVKQGSRLGDGAYLGEIVTPFENGWNVQASVVLRGADE